MHPAGLAHPHGGGLQDQGGQRHPQAGGAVCPPRHVPGGVGGSSGPVYGLLRGPQRGPHRPLLGDGPGSGRLKAGGGGHRRAHQQGPLPGRGGDGAVLPWGVHPHPGGTARSAHQARPHLALCPHGADGSQAGHHPLCGGQQRGHPYREKRLAGHLWGAVGLPQPLRTGAGGGPPLGGAARTAPLSGAGPS